MSLQFDVDRGYWLDADAVAFPVACSALLGKGVNATVDPFTGDIVTLRCLAPRQREQMAPVLAHLASDPRGRSIVRRLTLASAFAADDLPGTEPYHLLDRLHARIDLAEFAPQLEFGFDDPELDAVLAALDAGDVGITESNRFAVDAALDAVWRFTSKPIRQPAHVRRAGGFLDAPRSAEGHAASTIRVASLSYGADLALGSSAIRVAALAKNDNVLSITLPIPFAAHFGDKVDFYLTEPDLDDAVTAIARPTVTPGVGVDGNPTAVLTARMLVPASFEAERAELLLVPSIAGGLPPSAGRQFAIAEVRARTAIRLAQKKLPTPALEAALDAVAVLQKARAEKAVIARARAIADAIERGDLDGGGLADL